jgi:hypothetical protein
MPAKASLASLGALGSADVVIVLGLEDLDALNLVEEREKGKVEKNVFLFNFIFSFFLRRRRRKDPRQAPLHTIRERGRRRPRTCRRR